MTIEELAAAHPTPWTSIGVPDQMLGCFKRRSITFFTGQTDSTTNVYWLQSRGLSADFRFQQCESDFSRRRCLSEYTRDEIDLLALREGGFAETTWNENVMTWHGWTAFQLHSKWPEPAQVFRIGDCAIELAPSGAYVEDWRFQLSSPGPLIGLQMIDERNVETGEVLHRGGGLIICGRHAAFVRGRAVNLPEGHTLADLIQQNPADSSLLEGVFACDASLATRSGKSGPFTVAYSTDPRREGENLTNLDGFSFDSPSQIVRQRLQEHGLELERVFKADTLCAWFPFRSATSASAEAHSWLRRESGTLLAYVEAMEA
jgi:hypothetical protein